MIGTQLGRYRIVERLGKGGMGVVYRAEDPRLEREVAIKVLPEDAHGDEQALGRFRREARALSRLLHPNIATLFDFDADGGVEFLVLELVPGETLAQLLRGGPLPEARARAIGIEIAEALGAAHEQGIVHRDLKPANVVITPRGRAKVLDFGLARLLSDAGGARVRTTTVDEGALVGTVSYMAPEQIQGDRIDPRTDLYAVGVLLFEMASGALPIAATDLPSTLYRIAHAPPRKLREARPGVSRELDAIVARCLEKDPNRRFPDARALVQALRGESSEIAAAAAPGAERPRYTGPGAPDQSEEPVEPDSRGRIRALAVLPFENRSGDPEQEFFTDGMTDALITGLAQIGALRVISRTSAMRFKGARKPLPEIARELQVDAVVEGSVLRAGDRVRITAQLVEAASDRSLWAQSYERNITDILSLQSELARAIADGIRVRITPDEAARLVAKGPVDPAAHVAYLQGRFLWNRWTADALRQSIEKFEQALAIDPNYAMAWAGIADSYGVLGNINAIPAPEAYAAAKRAAERGLAIDPNVAELHTSLGYVHRFFDWDWPRSEREFLRALELNPGYATARRWYAQLVSGLGRHDEAIAEAERALALDPLALIIYTAVGDVYFYARRYAESAEFYRRCLALDLSFGPGHTDLARALDFMGDPEEALREFRLGSSADGRLPVSTGHATLMLRAGLRDEAFAMVNELIERAKTSFVPAYGFGSFFAVAGDRDQALTWLERAYEQHDGTLTLMKVHPRLDPLREEPRFREVLRKMRLDT